ncbi:MAG TPA: hypothetical protein VGN76_13290 [Gemmatimonadales bacterium]|jgi:hypothetical protein|nr:hypothetical protein [Gemmatimonadales bacterium]
MPVPLFTQPEIEAAFGLILPPEVATRAARVWWEQFASEVDERGYFLYEDHLAGIKGAHGLAIASPLPESEQRSQERLFWGSTPVEERLEYLMRFSSFHIGLVGLVSEELHERMRTAEGLTLEGADRRRAQMRRIVDAINS